VFGTVPALAAYADGGGRSKTVAYPVPARGTGTSENPVSVLASPDGDYRLTFTIWRPQRKVLPGELGVDWIDIGGLTYSVVGRVIDGGTGPWTCPPSAYAPGGDQVVTASGLSDSSGSVPVDPSNTMTFTVNVSECQRFSGIPDWASGSLGVSEIFVAAKDRFGDGAEGVGFSFRPGRTQPSSSGAFSGIWRFHDDPAASTVDWTIQANQFPTSRFAIRVNGGYSLSGGTTPPGGWTCGSTTRGRPNDTWTCTGGTLAPGQQLSGSVDVADSGGTMGFALVAPETENGNDIEYTMPAG